MIIIIVSTIEQIFKIVLNGTSRQQIEANLARCCQAELSSPTGLLTDIAHKTEFWTCQQHKALNSMESIWY